MVHGPGCALLQNARRVFGQWRGPKALEWIAGDQTDFYDQDMQVDQAVAAIDRWFATYCGGSFTSEAAQLEEAS